MAHNRVAEIDRLYQDVVSYQSSTSFYDLLQFVRRFPQLAPYNAMLVHIQKPGSSFVASAADWKNRYGRNVTPGARPLLILKPFGPVSFVYEYNDTYGAPLPDELIAPFKSNTRMNAGWLRILIRNMKAEGIDVIYQDLGSDRAGSMHYHDDGTVIELPGYGRITRIRSNHCVVVNKNLGPTEQYTTILHELGHLYCGHLYHDLKVHKWLPQRFDIGLNINQMEFEAETVCWIVCERKGIDNPSISYLNSYLEKNASIPNVSIDTIMKAAGIVEALTEGLRACRKELIIKPSEKE